MIDYWASWCGPCKSLKPQYSALAAKEPEAVFCSVNVENETLSGVEEVASVDKLPTIRFFRDGIQMAEYMVREDMCCACMLVT